ncbi:MAG: hypothetical protein II388_12375 [Clostridia bacterium]|nr:hypothetical protein [Clostridia bacterium]
MPEVITYKEFDRYINSIRATMELSDKIDELAMCFNRTNASEFRICFPSLISETIELLEKLVSDEDHWIDYYIFELSFGKWNDTMNVEDADGNTIPLKTTKDLWNIIHKAQ